jgi:hypothetical protein
MPTGFVKDSSSVLYWIQKGPGEDLNYSINWKKTGDDWLGAATIQTSTWSIAPNGALPALQKHGESINGGYTICWLNGGVLGTTYIVTNTLVASDGRTASRSFEVRIIKR